MHLRSVTACFVVLLSAGHLSAEPLRLHGGVAAGHAISGHQKDEYAWGAGAWAGLVMPSVDRVGRYFPLTVLRACGELPQALAAREWFAELDRAARRVLDVEFTIDEFERELAQVPPCEDRADAQSHERAAQLLQAFASPARCTVWWLGDAGEEGTRFRGYEGLPPSSAFTSLLGRAA